MITHVACHPCRAFCNPLYGRKSFPGGSVVKKNLPANVGHLGSIPGSGRSPGEGNGIPLQYSYLQNFKERGVWGYKRVGHDRN